MNPYKFEQLVSLLLQEMGYTNVKVTAPSNDKGVDVVADIEAETASGSTGFHSPPPLYTPTGSPISLDLLREDRDR